MAYIRDDGILWRPFKLGKQSWEEGKKYLKFQLDLTSTAEFQNAFQLRSYEGYKVKFKNTETHKI